MKTFYIGWLEAKIPTKHWKNIKLFIYLIIVFIPFIAIIFAFSQIGFNNAKFEYGTNIELKGILLKKPVPAIRIFHDKNIFNEQVYQTIPLVSYGKFGALSVLEKFENKSKKQLNQLLATIEGTLIYKDGKTLFELSKQENSLISLAEKPENYSNEFVYSKIENYGKISLNGEIVDPKCYFGVMKPGEGKVHKACAILCISGGIPPVFVVENKKQEKNYYLLIDESGNPINNRILDYIAIPINIEGHLSKMDDWFILNVHKINNNKLN